MMAECSARVIVADPDTIGPVREAIGLLETARNGGFEGIDPALLDGVPTARVIAVGSTLQPTERSYDALLAAAAENPSRQLPVNDTESLAGRSGERWVGKECVSPGRTR